MTEEQPAEDRICFVIAPIGDGETETGVRSDQVLRHIINPAAAGCGYTTLRADESARPGIITSQIIRQLLTAPMVIADLTDRNANVFYELAIRHAFRKPVVQMIHKRQEVPFDLAAMRTVQFDHHDLDNVDQCREKLAEQIRAAEQEPDEIDTPISQATRLQALYTSEEPLAKSGTEMVAMVQELRDEVHRIAGLVDARRELILIMKFQQGLMGVLHSLGKLQEAFGPLAAPRDATLIALSEVIGRLDGLRGILAGALHEPAQ